jgi:hypothetical protein
VPIPPEARLGFVTRLKSFFLGNQESRDETYWLARLHSVPHRPDSNDVRPKNVVPQQHKENQSAASTANLGNLTTEYAGFNNVDEKVGVFIEELIALT